MSDLTKLSLAEARDAVASKTVSAVELTKAQAKELKALLDEVFEEPKVTYVPYPQPVTPWWERPHRWWTTTVTSGSTAKWTLNSGDSSTERIPD